MAGAKRTWISPQLKEDIVRGHQDYKMTVSDLHRKYSCAYNTVNKIVKTTPYGFWNIDLPGRIIEPPITNTRKNLVHSERVRLITDDALKVVELTLQAMKEMLENHRESLSAPQLCGFLNAVAPIHCSRRINKRNL